MIDTREQTIERMDVDEPLPIEVAEDWDAQLAQAEQVCRLVDRHLAYERARLYGDHLQPQGLCKEQKVALITDCWAVTLSKDFSRNQKEDFLQS